MEIPPSGTNEATQFWMAFWPALYSGLLYSIVTGIVVGVIILFFQRHTERKIARRSYSRELSIMKQRIREATSCPDPFILSSATGSVPQPAKEAIQVIHHWPISLWREELSDQKEFLDAVHKLQLSYSEFQIAAKHLDYLLKQFARTYNSKSNRMSVNDPSLQTFILGRLCGFAPDALVPWLGMPVQTPPPWMELGFTEAERNQDIRSAHKTYTEKRDNLQAKLSILIQKINT